MKMVSCRDWDGKMHKISEKEISFRISVYGVIIQEGNILVCPQRDGYDFPGGGIKIGEILSQAFVREIQEETGLTVAMGKILQSESEFYFSVTKKKAYNNVLLWYEGKNPRGEISTDGFDEYEKFYARKAEWIPFSDISKLKFHNPFARKLAQKMCKKSL